MTTLHVHSVLERNPEIAHRVVDGTAVLVNPLDAKMFTLNEVGTYIWSHIGEKSVRQVVMAIDEEFELGEGGDSTALEHTLSFLTELERRALVRVKPLTAESVLEQNPDIVHRIDDETAVLGNRLAGKMFTLNDVGAYIWSHLEGRSIQQIVSGIGEEFDLGDGDEAAALEHVISFLTELERRALVRVAGS